MISRRFGDSFSFLRNHSLLINIPFSCYFRYLLSLELLFAFCFFISIWVLLRPLMLLLLTSLNSHPKHSSLKNHSRRFKSPWGAILDVHSNHPSRHLPSDRSRFVQRIWNRQEEWTWNRSLLLKYYEDPNIVAKHLTASYCLRKMTYCSWLIR